MEEGTIRRRIVDSREPWEIAEKLLESGWEREALASGDFRIIAHDGKKVGITRKTISDLLNSIAGKRDPKTGKRGKPFGVQLEEMLEVYDLKIFLFEGTWTGLTDGDKIITPSRGIEAYTWDFVWDFIRSWQDRGFTLEMTRNQGHTIRRLNRLYAYYQKPYHTGGATVKSSVGDDRVMAFPLGTRGKCAIDLLNHFGSLTAVGQAKISDLLEVNGIGRVKAEAVRIHFNKDGRK